MSETTFQKEPEAPAISFSERPLKGFEIKRQGQLENQDRIEWQRDMEQRRSRPVKRLEPVAVDIVSELDSALSTLESAADDFDNSFGKPNQALIDAKIEAIRLRAELATAEARLKDLELKRDSVNRLQNAVGMAEAPTTRAIGNSRDRSGQSFGACALWLGHTAQ
jgi:hypothetical protein